MTLNTHHKNLYGSSIAVIASLVVAPFGSPLTSERKT